MNCTTIVKFLNCNAGKGKIKFILRCEIHIDLGNGISMPIQKGCRALVGFDNKLIEVNGGRHSFKNEKGEDIWVDNIRLDARGKYALFLIVEDALDKADINDLMKLPEYKPCASQTTVLCKDMNIERRDAI